MALLYGMSVFPLTEGGSDDLHRCGPSFADRVANLTGFHAVADTPSSLAAF